MVDTDKPRYSSATIFRAVALLLFVVVGVQYWLLSERKETIRSLRQRVNSQAAVTGELATARRPARTRTAAVTSLSELTEGQTPIPKALRIRDLAGHLQDVVSAGLDVPDITLPYYKSGRATVHMHVVGKRQIVPLHVHLRAEEASVIVSGEPDVTLTYLEGEEIRTEAAIEKPGSLIYSPVLCAHAWSNPADALQGNLVFAIPPFTGNLYISPTDSRLTPLARPPLRSRPEELVALLRASGRSVFSRVLPGMQGTMREVALTGQTELPAEPGEPNIAYVRRGTGRVGTSAVDLQPVRAQHLISAEGALQLHGTEDDPLVVLVFRPEYDASAGIEGTSSATTERP